MKSFQTKTASWVLRDGKWRITQYSGSKAVGEVELFPEDMAQAVEAIEKMVEKERNHG